MNWRQFVRATRRSIVVAVPVAALAAPVSANSAELAFETHAAFFSQETGQPKALDPQVFVRDGANPAAVGPQNIKHAAGVRPAFVDQDPKNAPVFNAEAQPLNFDLGQWLSAKGAVSIRPAPGGKAQISATFHALQPGGHYSLFENHFDQKPIGFTPLDGTGTANNFVASATGTAQINVLAPSVPTHANAVLLVYHSDGQNHGGERGEIGITAHHQLIARIPQ